MTVARRKRTGSAKPIAGKCGARLKGNDAGRFCNDTPVQGRVRCRNHGGLSLRAAAAPKFKHGLKVITPSAEFAEPYSQHELQLINRWRLNVEEAVRIGIGELGVWRERALARGNIPAAVAISTALATNARALVSLREMPLPEKSIPGMVVVTEGKTIADFEQDLLIVRREAEVGRAS